MKDLKLSIEKKDEIESEYNTLQSSYQTVRELFEKKKELSDIVDQYTYHYNKQLKEYNDNEYRLQSYQSLNEELNTYNMRYDEMELVKSALSSKEGIPLLYIQVYLKNIQEITNELLEIIYEDELYIDNFNITADEFKIPYVKNGKSIKDVCYASQGERSFISLALSFALIYQSISRYNIMLLDEIDATLDTSNREKFLQILEKQLGMIEGEQIFLISHNNMFNMYPVDIIDMHNKQNSDNKLANYIQIKIL
jgi:DNA repair exonuclease SbcCD ATPase subunit